jgi:RNA polymerase sigma-70 factor, ECF subfamily
VTEPRDTPFTTVLNAAADGDAGAAADLAPLVYDQLHGLARAYLRRGAPDAALQTTALLHEAFVRLLAGADVRWQSRAHFLAVGAKAMRQILVSHARAAGAAKRGGQMVRISLSEAERQGAVAAGAGADAAAIDEALGRLAELDPRQARITEMRVFGGMTIDEVACVLGVSTATVEREWRAARAWLGAQLRREEP